MSTPPVNPDALREGGYRLIEPIGGGGFGTVWRGELTGPSGFRKVVAIKLLNDAGQDDPELGRRLRDEARLLALLRHRAVVGVDDLVRFEQRWAVVMEFVPGADLQELLDEAPLPPRACAEVIREAALALDCAHGARHPETGEPLSIIHRDIKPANIRLTRAGEVKVLDFGIAHARFGMREAKTASMRFGSPGYVAPERFDGDDRPASDIFSLGVVLVEALLGHRIGQLPVRPSAFLEERDDAVDSLPASTPEPLRELARRMLAYEPEDRPAAAEVARVLQELGGTLEGPWLVDWARAHVPGPEAAVGANPTLSVPEDTGGGSTWTSRSWLHGDPSDALPQAAPPPPPRPPVASIAVGAALVLGVALGAWALIDDPAVEPEPDAPAAVVPSEIPTTSVSSPDPAPEPPPAEPDGDPVDAPATAPPPEPEPVPAAPAPPPPATVRVEGTVSAFTLLTADGRAVPPGEVAPGTYGARWRFDDGEPIEKPALLTVGAGETAVVRCNALTLLCAPR
ncbi:MAG: serine/threonine protein kinase [Alphaproteobacteria bacterium]|nr:serine/threonine protein kinase [Alphaproteobacteria bacterium]